MPGYPIHFAFFRTTPMRCDMAPMLNEGHAELMLQVGIRLLSHRRTILEYRPVKCAMRLKPGKHGNIKKTKRCRSARLTLKLQLDVERSARC
jgi:hypothetical protein